MNRKDDHIALAARQEILTNDFDKVRFVHNALPGVSMNAVDYRTTIAGFDIPVPIYINAMTGGSEKAMTINTKLAEIAASLGIPMALGSASIALKKKETAATFTIVRKHNPDGLIMANIGAGVLLKDAKEAVDLLKADILQLHINAVQEVIMPEGDRDFSQWRENIRSLTKEIDVPVIVKEVGFGMSKATITELKDCGVKIIDLSGKGGTDFAAIENRRRDKPMPFFNGWGLSTVESLLEARDSEGIRFLASGGIRNALDVVKALALGADAVGLSRFFLDLALNETTEAATEKTMDLLDEIKSIMTVLGAPSVEALRKTPIVLSDSLLTFVQQRQ